MVHACQCAITELAKGSLPCSHDETNRDPNPNRPSRRLTLTLTVPHVPHHANYVYLNYSMNTNCVVLL